MKLIPGYEKKLIDLGVPAHLLLDVRLPLVCAMKIRPDGDLFEFDDDGIGAVVLIEGERDSIGLDWLTMDDLIAFRTGEPGRWWRRYGRARWLGQDAVDRAVNGWPDYEPLRLFRDPLQWLRAGGAEDCAVPIEPDAIDDLLRVPSFVVRDELFGREIGRKLKALAVARLPKIGVEATGQQVAA